MAEQYYLQQTEESDTDEEKRKTMEMRGYALACLTLVLGRMDARRLDTTLQDLGPELLKALFDQVHHSTRGILNSSIEKTLRKKKKTKRRRQEKKTKHYGNWEKISDSIAAAWFLIQFV